MTAVATKVELTRRLFTADEYHLMAEAGVFKEGERVELLDGEIFVMAPTGGPHITSVMRLNMLLVKRIPEGWGVSVQGSLRLEPRTEPEPDFAIVRDRVYRGPPPGPEDTAFVVEVADSSLRYDREVKKAYYARAGIREYWVVDLGSGAVERYSEPDGETYRKVQRKVRGETITSTVIPQLEIPVDAFLVPAEAPEVADEEPNGTSRGEA